MSRERDALLKLWGLWNNPKWVGYKADYLGGHLSYANMLEEQERSICAALSAADGPAAERDRDFQTPLPEHLPDLLDDWADQGTHAQEYPYTALLMEEAAKHLRVLQSQERPEPKP